ncbi:Hypothetical predicted protein [Marmota monax]|uniref:Uncharacterized protein n=1 Tax=Marmota monax TaxID=9995 RepID=A0A5E4D5U4_MARMO|nr:Hypothetical predicted protein [Marmota monax]
MSSSNRLPGRMELPVGPERDLLRRRLDGDLEEVQFEDVAEGWNEVNYDCQPLLVTLVQNEVSSTHPGSRNPSYEDEDGSISLVHFWYTFILRNNSFRLSPRPPILDNDRPQMSDRTTVPPPKCVMDDKRNLLKR